ncbi:hypothetical protein B0J13DRAFT_185685 [Dactylonectria estremocensis]|uniref:Uncharacterized protein n=1 Tax=Dactylonectria estremocensis TaxID=1079267 RepID=A0A9P9JEY5_9HYPO|nr:hypothetical protein B0J13DRAFT_185685 [Dactylonectria estremocensis]
MSTSPLLDPMAERSGSGDYSPLYHKNTRRSCGSFFQDALGPSWIAYDAICHMANTEDPEERDQLTRNWRDHKIQELRFVGTVGALLAGCLASTGSWPNVLPDGRDKPWSVRACWYSGLLFALFAVIVSCQQSMRLHRLSAHRDGLQYIRASLTGEKKSEGRRPLKRQVYAWEAGVVFLTGSIVCAITGLTGLVWLGTIYGDDAEEDGRWGENKKVSAPVKDSIP